MPRRKLIRLRRGTAAEWTAEDPVLASGEPGYETDTGTFKIGDGVTAWSSLPSAGGGDVPPDVLTESDIGVTVASQSDVDGRIARTGETRQVSLISSDVLVGAPTKAANPATKSYVDARIDPALPDTAWADLSMDYGWTATVRRYRRYRGMIQVQFTELSNASATGGTFATLPVGFRPEHPVSLLLPTSYDFGASVIAGAISTGGLISGPDSATPISAARVFREFPAF